MSPGLCRQQKRWSAKGRAERAGLSLGPWASPRRAEWVERLDRLGPRIETLDEVVQAEAERRPEAVELRKQKGWVR